MEVEWTILPRGDVAAHWSGLYVTMNRLGSIVMSRVTWERLGGPGFEVVPLAAVAAVVVGDEVLSPAEAGRRAAGLG